MLHESQERIEKLGLDRLMENGSGLLRKGVLELDEGLSIDSNVFGEPDIDFDDVNEDFLENGDEGYAIPQEHDSAVPSTDDVSATTDKNGKTDNKNEDNNSGNQNDGNTDNGGDNKDDGSSDDSDDDGEEGEVNPWL